MRQKVCALILCAAMVMGLCGCSVDLTRELLSRLEQEFSVPMPEETTATTTTTLPSVDVPLTLLDHGYAYATLDEKQQANYDAVVQALYEKRGQDTEVDGTPGLGVSLPHVLETPQEVEDLFLAVCDDHPEFFYLDQQYGWLSLGQFYTTLRFYYIWDAQERAAKAIELEAAVSSLVIQAQGLSAVEQELLFHDALTERCDYNDAAAAEVEAEETSYAHSAASSAYAALCSGDPICGGYSRAFELLLSRVGIQNTPIDNDDHTWTMVWLDGEAYHVDVTWDDPSDGEEHHDYFNITDAEIRATRDYPAQTYEVPVADATAYSYYSMNGWYFADAFDDTLDDRIREQIENGKAVVELKFAPEAFIDAGSWLFDDEFFFEAVYELEDDTLRDEWYGTVLYEEDEMLCTIKIYPDEGDIV